MTTQAESTTVTTPAAATPPATPSTTVPASPPATPAETPAATPDPKIEVKDGSAKELAERMKLRRELEAARKESADYKAKYETLKPWEERQAKGKERPLDLLKELGLTFDDVTQAVLRGDAPPTPKAEPTETEKDLAETKRELAELRAWKEAQEKERTDRSESESKRALAAYDDQLKTLLSAPEKYPFALASEDSLDDVVKTATAVRNQHWADTTERNDKGQITKRGEVLTAEQALQKVDDYWRAKFARAPGSKPAAGQPPAAPAKQSAQPAQPETKPQPITNKLTPPPATPPAEPPKMSREERFQASIEALRAKRKAERGAVPNH